MAKVIVEQAQSLIEQGNRRAEISCRSPGMKTVFGFVDGFLHACKVDNTG